MKKQKLYFIFFVSILFVLVVYNYYLAQHTQTLINLVNSQIEELKKPVNLKMIIIDANCDVCFDIKEVVDNIRSNERINVTEVEVYSLTDSDVRALVLSYSIDRLPTVILEGEIDKVQLAGFENKGSAFVFTAINPPYYDTKSKKVVGLVKAIYINASYCDLCRENYQTIEFLEQNGVVFESKLFLDINSSQAQQIINTYNLKSIPVLLLSQDIEAYNIQLSDLGLNKVNDFYIVYSAPPYVDSESGEIRGLAELILLRNSSCDQCYDVSIHSEILRNRFGVAIINETYVEVDSEFGQQLISKYNITKIPTIIILGDLEPYTALNNIWSNVGSIENDGAYVFRNMDALGNAVYIDLTLNKIVGAEEVREIVIAGSDFNFTPNEIRVKVGEKVRIVFRNEGEVGHNLVIEGYNIGTNVIPSGATQPIEFVADQVGEFAFYCSVPGHRDLGMEGLLIVEE